MYEAEVGRTGEMQGLKTIFASFKSIGRKCFKLFGTIISREVNLLLINIETLRRSSFAPNIRVLLSLS